MKFCLPDDCAGDLAALALIADIADQQGGGQQRIGDGDGVGAVFVGDGAAVRIFNKQVGRDERVAGLGVGDGAADGFLGMGG
ncbi:MAG: hypothetical protein U5J63_17810 [Fodinibius sp.]|nr:hypothetical protein [Fodinibius sp.]